VQAEPHRRDGPSVLCTDDPSLRAHLNDSGLNSCKNRKDYGMMKKLIAVFLVLCVCAMMAAAGAEADYTGTWFLTKVIVQDMELDPSSLGVGMCVELKADGTAEFTTLNYTLLHVEKGSWAEKDGKLAYAGEEGTTVEFAPEGEALKMGMSEIDYIFEKNGAEPLKVPQKVALESNSDLNGVWALNLIGLNETLYQPAYFGINGSMYYICQDGTVSELVVPEEGDPSETYLIYDLVDGSLVAKQEVEGIAVTIEIVKLDNGMMVEYVSSVNGTYEFYCQYFCTLEELAELAAMAEAEVGQ